jgi:DHA1 family multidrug resistance protein-like MFS transporter
MQDTREAAPAAVEGRTGRSFPLILVSLLVISIGFGFTSPFLPLFIQEIGRFDAREAAFWSGVVSACSGAVMTVAGPIWGILADWFGHKRNVLRAAFGAFIVMSATALVQNVPQLAVTRVLMGAVSGVTPATMGLLGALMPRQRLPFAVGVAQGMSSLGFTLGPLLGGVMVVWLGYRLGFAFAGAMIGVAGLIVLLGVPSPARAVTTTERNGHEMWSEFRHLLSAKGLKAALLVVAAVQLAPNLVFPATPFFVKSLSGGVNAGAVGLYFTISGLAMSLAAWGMGALSNRFSLRTLMLMACAITAGGALALSGAQSLPVALAWGGVVGAGVGFLTAGASAWVGTVAPHGRSGAAFGVVQSANAIGFGLGPFVGGIVAAGLGLRAPFIAEAVLAAALGVVVLRFAGR